MELVNHTAVPAAVHVVPLSDSERGGVITAQATYRFSPGHVELDTQSPIALSLQPIETELGLLPPDQPYLAADDRFEVVVLGCAYAPKQRPVTETVVAVMVGEVRRELVVTGDRGWAVQDGQHLMTKPALFTRMPLTWDRAFGGCCLVELDAGTFIRTVDPINPHGRGYDVDEMVHQYVAWYGAVEGYPRYAYQRMLPNIERPVERVRTPHDRPRPACWATRPVDCGLRATHIAEGLPDRIMPLAEAASPSTVIRSLRSASDEWVIDPPRAGATVTLAGLTPDGTVSFALPEQQVLADYAIADRRGTLALRPQQLVLLPEERRLTLTYRAMFRVPYDPEQERSMRLRLAS